MKKNSLQSAIPYIVVAAGIYLFWKYQRDEKKKKESLGIEETGTGTGTSTGTTTNTTTMLKGIVVGRFPLKKGSKGELVTRLQTALLKIDSKSLPKYGADGDYGTETENAVLKVINSKTVDSESALAGIELIAKMKPGG
jgi:hypothetical protein